MICYSTFPFLQQRYKPGFYTGILNRYFVILAFFSNRAQISFEALLEFTLNVLFTDKIAELNKYHPENNYLLVRGYKFDVDRDHFLKLNSEDHIIITIIYLHTRKLKPSRGKKVHVADLVKLLIQLKDLEDSDLPPLKLWKVSTMTVFVGTYNLEEVTPFFDKHAKEIHIKMSQAELEKTLPVLTILLLRDYENFISEFLLKIKTHLPGRIKSVILSYFYQYRKDMEHFYHIKELIKAGIL